MTEDDREQRMAQAMEDARRMRANAEQRYVRQMLAKGYSPWRDAKPKRAKKMTTIQYLWWQLMEKLGL